MTQDNSTAQLLPSTALFCRGTVPEPLTEEERTWLLNQLHHYPNRVDESRTCAIGALTDMATTEFCRLMAERLTRAPVSQDAAQLVEALKERIRIFVWNYHKRRGATDERAMQCVEQEIEALTRPQPSTELDMGAQEADGQDFIEALTPSAETKAAYSGEFTIPWPVVGEDGNDHIIRINVPWTTIKEIMAAIRARAETHQGDSTK